MDPFLLREPPLYNLVAMISERTTAPVELSDIVEVSHPEPYEGTYANTKIRMRTSLDFSHAGWGELLYRRIPLSDFEAINAGATMFDMDGIREYLWHFSQNQRIHMDDNEIELAEPFDPLNWPLEYAATFQAKPESLMYVGSGKLIIRTYWRFAAPEVNEAQVDRLRTLLHVTMPQTFSF